MNNPDQVAITMQLVCTGCTRITGECTCHYTPQWTYPCALLASWSSSSLHIMSFSVLLAKSSLVFLDALILSSFDVRSRITFAIGVKPGEEALLVSHVYSYSLQIYTESFC